jgi:hypothetical protein
MILFINIFRRIIFWAAILFFISLISGLILFSVLSLEFKNSSYFGDVYLYLVLLIPLAILFTMTGTIKKRNSSNKNWGIAGLTSIIAIIVFVTMFSLIMQIAWGGWANEAILYRNKKDNNISVNEQVWDVGALGYDRGSKRVVELKPIFYYFYQVRLIDTTHLDRNEWTFVNEEGDIHFP